LTLTIFQTREIRAVEHQGSETSRPNEPNFVSKSVQKDWNFLCGLYENVELKLTPLKLSKDKITEIEHLLLKSWISKQSKNLGFPKNPQPHQKCHIF
jgi:hypothetical protein